MAANRQRRGSSADEAGGFLARLHDFLGPLDVRNRDLKAALATWLKEQGI